MAAFPVRVEQASARNCSRIRAVSAVLTVVAASDSLLPDHMLLQGLLWVWMDSSAGATAASQQRQLPLPAELAAGPGEPPRGVLLGDW